MWCWAAVCLGWLSLAGFRCVDCFVSLVVFRLFDLWDLLCTLLWLLLVEVRCFGCRWWLFGLVVLGMVVYYRLLLLIVEMVLVIVNSVG